MKQTHDVFLLIKRAKKGITHDQQQRRKLKEGKGKDWFNGIQQIRRNLHKVIHHNGWISPFQGSLWPYSLMIKNRGTSCASCSITATTVSSSLRETTFLSVHTLGLDWIVVVLSPFELRTRHIGTYLPHYTEMSHSSLKPYRRSITGK